MSKYGGGRLKNIDLYGGIERYCEYVYIIFFKVPKSKINRAAS